MMQQDGEILTTQKLKSQKNKSLEQIMKNSTVGEIIQVEGGHIIKATGKKDRHSKVYTAKGARDRRVRLSANTAIQFYDVQDRLGYDRPSKAIDWLLKKAKYAIDKLEEEEDSTNKNEMMKRRDQSCCQICESEELGFLLNTHNHNYNRSNTNTTDQEELLHLGSNSVQFEQNYTNLVGKEEEEEINRVNGFVFNPQTIPPQQLFGNQNSAVEFSQRESLQSNYSQNMLQYSWNERMLPSLDQQINAPQPTFQPCLYNFYFGSNFQPTDHIHGHQEH